MSTMKVYKLSNLDEYNSWLLFVISAFDTVTEPVNSTIVEIAVEIVKKCGGNPFALHTVGMKLNLVNQEIEDWTNVLDTKF